MSLLNTQLFTLYTDIDVFDPQYEMWYIAKIIELIHDDDITNLKITAIRIHFFGYTSKYDETISLLDESWRFASLHTHTLKLTQLEKPQYLRADKPAPLYYHNNKMQQDCIILPSSGADDKRSIIKYDINNNKYSKLISLKQIGIDSIDIDTYSYSQIIDKSNNLLILFGGKNNIFITINIIACAYVNYKHAVGTPLTIHGSVYIPYPIDELHVIAGKPDLTHTRFRYEYEGHFRYNKDEGIYTQMNSVTIRKFYKISNYTKFIYVETQDKLILFGGSDSSFDRNFRREMFCTKVLCKKQLYYSWDQMKSSLPKASPHFEIVLAFNTMLFLFYFKEKDDKEIYCMDLMDDNLYCSWIKCDKPFPSNHCYIISTKLGYVHFLNWYNDETFHGRFSLYELIPGNIFKKYKKVQSLLVCGYVKEIDMKRRDRFDVLHQIPPEIMNMILAYTPL